MKSKMYKWTILLGTLLLMAVVIGGRPAPALADVSVGDVIDSSNWQKAQGLLPDAMLEYLKKGWFTIKVGKLNYDPADILNNEYKESLKKNIGRYSMTSKGEVVDKKTGEVDPMDIMGIPFPNIDPAKDPQAGLKMQVNQLWILHGRSNFMGTATLWFIGQKAERCIKGPQATMAFQGLSRNIAQQNQTKNMGKKVESCAIIKVTDPYELNGLAVMQWMFGDNTPDKVFAYVPALRRTRVMTAASKSDAMFGTDYSLDDANGWIGKPRDFNCKYIKTQDTLVRYISPDVIGMNKNPDGSYEVSKHFPAPVWGFQTPGWKGKPWATTGDFWVKRKANVIECSSKDPYYNYGKFELWVDPDTYRYAHKVIYDRAGKRWKVFDLAQGAILSKDGAFGHVDTGFGNWIYDEQRDHATGIEEYSPKEKKIWGSNHTTELFTQLGFTKFAK